MFNIAITCLIVGWISGFVTYFAVRCGVREVRKFNTEISEKENLHYADLQRS